MNAVMNARNVALTETADKVRALVETRKVRDAETLTCQNALRRSRNYNADFLKASFTEVFVDYGVDLDTLFSRCDKTLDRFCKVVDQIFNNDTLSPTDSRDQYRYTVNLIRSLVKANAANVSVLVKSDVLATATKRKTDNDFVQVASRLMCDSTAERQSGIAAKVLTDLGFCNAKFNGNKLVGLTLNTDSVIFAKICQMIADGK